MIKVEAKGRTPKDNGYSWNTILDAWLPDATVVIAVETRLLSG
jgi:hypothetical protein